MSDSIRKLNENPVTDLADADYIVACDASGALRPIKRSDFLSGIESGGRNLVKSAIKVIGNSKLNADGSVSFNQQMTDSYFYLYAATDMTNLIGETLTLSFECEGLPSGSTWAFGIGSQIMNHIIVTNGRVSKTFIGNEFTCPAKNGEILIDDSVAFSGNVSVIKLSNFMLERGSIAHDWTPAPEDILDRLTALENRGG